MQKRKQKSRQWLSPVSSSKFLVGQLYLPELKDANRNFAIKKIAEELASADTLAKVRESDPDSKLLHPAELSKFLVELEGGKSK